MDYAATLDFLYARLPMFSRIGAAAYKADLDNTLKLCESLGNPQQRFKTIHVAGTNGKGSVSHMLAAIFQQAGYKTGLYTSPHLREFGERIRINGEMIDEKFVIEFTESITPMIDEIEPSFFEITVAMAFDYFARQSVDIAIIEVGLGGRLDSTNIIHPELSVITNIGWDHMNLLGDSLDKIAMEKAGIIKPGVPVVVGETLPETIEVFRSTAARHSSPLIIATDRRQAIEWRWEAHHLVVSVATQHETDHQVYKLDLPGLYQSKNLLTVLEAVSQLRNIGWELSIPVVREALSKVRKLTGLKGRWEVIKEHPLLILDVGHNEAGIKQIVRQLEITDHHQLHIITGMVRDKDIEKVLELLPKDAKYYFTAAKIPRALPAEELAERAANYSLKGIISSDVNAAIKTALAAAHKDDLILVCGSVFLVGEVTVS